MKKDKIFQLKIVIFTPVKNRCMLHGRVIVMFVANLQRADVINGKFDFSVTKIFCGYFRLLGFSMN